MEKKLSWVEHAETINIEYEVQEKKDLVSIIVFQCGSEYYGTNISTVKEIVKSPAISAIPHIPKHIKGIANVRGNIITILDVALRINKLSSSQDGGHEFVVVLNHETIKLGLLVQTVPFTITTEVSNINRSSAVIQNLPEEDQFVQGLIKHEGKVIFLIDVFKMI